jgi:PmbA protein
MEDASLVVERALARALRAGASAADAVVIEGDLLEARVRGEEIDFVKQARERTLGLRAFAAGTGGLRTAVTSTSDLSPEVVDRMSEETVALARETASDPAAGLPDGGFASEIPDLQLFEPGDHPFDAEARIDQAYEAERSARAVDARIVNSEGSQIGSGFHEVVFANTVGFAASYRSASHSLFCEPLARNGGGMQRDYWMTTARRLAGLEAADRVGRRAAERALRRLGARPVTTCEVPVVFDPLTAPSLLRHLAACLNGYAIYRGTSYLAERLGERIASELVTVIDDGRLPGGLGSKPFDGEGLPTRRNVLLDAGRLERFVLDTYAGRKLGMASTGNAARSAGSGPSAATTNLWLEPGTLSPEEIIASTSRGLLVTELIGMGFNPVTGDYSRGAAGLWIEDGQITHPVEEVTIAGNLSEMLGAIDAVGNDLLWLGSAAAPTLRVSRMTVAGR